MLNDEQPFKVVRAWDEALVEMAEAEILEYRDRRDFSRLRFAANSRPMIFHVRTLRDDVAARLQDIIGDTERSLRAFAFAVVAVENAVDRNGVAFGGPMWQPSYIQSRTRGARYLTEAESSRFSPPTQVEIGAVALERSFFEPGTAPFYRQPPTSVRPLGALLSLRAAREKSTPTDGPSASAPPPERPSTGTDSDGPGAATAPESSTNQAAP